jgi:hypothetical protein
MLKKATVTLLYVLTFASTYEARGKAPITNYQPTLCNIPEEQRSHFHRGGSPKLQICDCNCPIFLFVGCAQYFFSSQLNSSLWPGRFQGEVFLNTFI